jgi:amino acid permease
MASQKELDHQYRMTRLVQNTSTARAVIRLLMVVAVCAALVLMTRALAGHITFADITFRAIAELYANRWSALMLSWMLTGASTSWAIGERALRRRHIKRVANEVSEMQRVIDAGKRSSRLRIDGNTRREDE